MDQELINKIRENTDIVELIGKYIPLQKRGKNYFGLCPFHNDNNPSLSVSREKQIYKCFVCGEAGNIYNFLMKYENISFVEAVKLAGNEIGISVSLSEKPKVDKNKKYYDIYDLALKFYQNNLFSKEGVEARKYLEDRKLDLETIKEFGIGLSLNKRGTLTDLLLKKGYSLNDLNEIGLSSGENDTYINRIIFPLHNINGIINGFSGRIYHGENINKYLNTKETPIFKKGENIFNYKRAKEEIRRAKFVIVMEGFMAVIRAWTVGIKNCIALMGTALTKEQIELIKKLSRTVYLCFDGDNAGLTATINNGKMFVDNNFDVKVILLENKLDPDDYIIKYGSERFISLIESAISYNDFKIKILKRGINFNSPDDLSNYINSVLKEISIERDEVKREILLKNLAKETNVWYNTLEKKLHELLSKEKKDDSQLNIPNQSVTKKKNKYEKAMQELIYYMLNSKEVITIVHNSNIYIPDEKYRGLIREISYYYEKYGIISMADFLTYIGDNEDLRKELNEIITLDLDNNVDNEVILELIKVIRNYNVALEIKRIEKMIMNEVDPIEQAKLSNQIMKLKMGSENNDK